MKSIINKAALKDALSVCDGIHRMNASSAIGYAFNISKDRKRVYCGEYVHTGEIIKQRYEYFISFERKEIMQFTTGKTASI